VAADGNQPVQMKLHKSLRLWTFYVDLEESLGNLESTREVYERILDLRIATPQVIINYAYFLEVWSNIYVLVQYLFWILLLLVVAH
jgi:pre-mRNA-splicing factor SYF1